jgi:hypothetical protein
MSASLLRPKVDRYAIRGLVNRVAKFAIDGHESQLM